MERDMLGSRMKEYEAIETEKTFQWSFDEPIYFRLDGRCFSSLTKNLQRPFDDNFHEIMKYTMSYLCDHLQCSLAYTQSDEISLIYFPKNEKHCIPFNGKKQKLISSSASMCSVRFIKLLAEYYPSLVDKFVGFDSRVIQMPSLMEVINMIVWRQIDCYKNSISMAARTHYSHKSLQGMSGKDMIQRMNNDNIIFENYPESFKFGTFYRDKEFFSIPHFKDECDKIGTLFPPKKEIENA